MDQPSRLLPKLLPLDVGLVADRSTCVDRVSLDANGLELFVASDGWRAHVSFSGNYGFRVLDEGDLTEFWRHATLQVGWLYEVLEGGWMALELTRDTFISGRFPGVREFLVIGYNECVSVLSDEPPAVVRVDTSQNAGPAAGAVIYAKHLDRVTAFYAAVTGLPVVESDASYALLASSSYQLVIHAIPAAYAAEIVIADPPARREDTAIKLIFTVPSIATARAQAAQQGGVVDGPEWEWQFQQYRVCDGHDPEGNVIQVREWISPDV